LPADAGVAGPAKCQDAKVKAAGKKTLDLLKALGKTAKKPNSAKLASAVSKAQSKFTKAFSKAEDEGACLTSADAGSIEAKVDSFVDEVLVAQQGMKPNIVLVFADDLGYGDLSSYGNTQIHTPHIDRMADEGVMFTQFYAGNSVCSPSRAALLTGRYSIRMPLDPRGVLFPDSTGGLEPAEITIAELLKEQGYRTALIGKWHLGHLPAFMPMEQGFDYFYGTPYSNDMDAPVYPGEETPENPCFRFLPDCRPLVPLMENGAILEMPAIQETLTQRYTQKALEFIQDAVESGQPFFLYYASNFPHVPLYASEDFLGTSEGGLYGDVVAELDWSVGEILAKVHELGIDDDTLVVFTSDNGPWLLWATDAEVPQGGLDSGTAEPLRHGKSTTFEGGARVPMIARWPGRIPAGRTVHEPAILADLMPTLARLAGGAPPDDREIDGKNIMPLLGGYGLRDAEGDFRYLLVRSSNLELGGYIEGKWKLKLKVVGGESVYAVYDHEDLLFDLEADPGEQNDLAPSMPDKVAELKERMEGLAAELGIPVGP
jgi:arylsulfatase A-like enzyme